MATHTETHALLLLLSHLPPSLPPPLAASDRPAVYTSPPLHSFLDSSATGDKGIADLAKALTTGMRSIQRLALQHCQLSNKGLKSLVRATRRVARAAACTL